MEYSRLRAARAKVKLTLPFAPYRRSMTPDELNRTIEFTIQSQARLAAAQEQDPRPFEEIGMSPQCRRGIGLSLSFGTAQPSHATLGVETSHRLRKAEPE